MKRDGIFGEEMRDSVMLGQLLPEFRKAVALQDTKKVLDLLETDYDFLNNLRLAENLTFCLVYDAKLLTGTLKSLANNGFEVLSLQSFRYLIDEMKEVIF